MRFTKFLFSTFVLLGLSSTLAHADISVLIFDNTGSADKIIYTGHSTYVLWDVCAETPTQLRPCLCDEEKGVVLNKLPKMSAEKYNWIATPVTEFLYGASSPDAAPILATKGVSEGENKKRYEEYFYKSISDAADKGRWVNSVGALYVRTVYEYQMSGFQDDEVTIMNRLNSSPNVSNYDIFFHNCADFVNAALKPIFNENLTHSVNGAGLHTPKTIARNLTKLALENPDLHMIVIKHPQISGEYTRSSSVMEPSENLYKNPLFAIPLTLLVPEIPLAALLLNEVFHPFRQESAYIKSLTLEQKLAILGTPEEWKDYRSQFHDLAAKAKNDSSLPTELHDVIANAKSDKDVSKKLIAYFALHGKYETEGDDLEMKLQIQGESQPRTIGMTRETILNGDKQVGYLVMLADLGQILFERARIRSSMEDFKKDWALLQSMSADDSRDPASVDDAIEAADGVFDYSITQCAVSQMVRKNVTEDGFGGEYGHSLLYIKGACRDTSAAYPKLKMCDTTAGQPTGAIVSLDSIYDNTSFIVMDGKDWLFDAGLGKDQTLTQDFFDRVVARALKTGVAKGVKLDDNSTEEEETVRRSTQTDWAVSFARDAACVRIPMNEKQIQTAVESLNSENEIFVTDKKEFIWDKFTNNCVTFGRSLFSKLGFRNSVGAPRGMFKKAEELGEAMKSELPIPAMDLVQTIESANNVAQIDTAENVFNDKRLRNYFLKFDTLPAFSGGSVYFVPMHEKNNDLYSHGGKMIFDKLSGHSNESKWKDFLADPQYSTVDGNLSRVLSQLKTVQSARKKGKINTSSDSGKFAVKYNAWIDQSILDLTSKIDEFKSSSASEGSE